MRFPWLQVDADFIGAKASDLGALLGISRREAMGLALDLWTWALARARDDAPPDGCVTGTGTEPDRLLSGAVGWTGAVEDLSRALVAVGLAERLADGYRLTGFGRYKTTWEKNRRRTGAKPERNRTGAGGEPARKTQTQTQTQIETPSGGAAAASPEVQQVALVDVTPMSPPEKPKPARAPRKPASGPNAKLWRALEVEYQKRMGSPYASGNGGADAAAVSWLLAQTTDTEAVRRWGNLLTWSKSGFPTVSGFTALRQHWNAAQVVGRVAPKVAGWAPPGSADSFEEGLPPVASWQSDNHGDEDDAGIPI